MNTSTISPKYQIVIPKELRQKLELRPGQKVYLANGKDGEIIVQTSSQVAKLYGSMRGAWGADSDQYLRDLRTEANRDRA